jgi:hypothetical protein
MALFDLQAMIEKLSQAPPVQEAIDNLIRIKTNHANSMIRMDARFDALEAKLDRLLLLAEKPVSNMVPAADDGLLKLLASESAILVCPIVGCTNTAVHGHIELSSTNCYQAPIPEPSRDLQIQ